MAFTFGFFHDAALTQPVSAVAPYLRYGSADGAVPFADGVVYLGSADDTRQAQVSPAVGTPGTTHISVSVLDADVGAGIPASAVKMALSSGGLDVATGGAPLDLGVTSIAGGVVGAVPIHIRVSGITTEGDYTDLSLACIRLLDLAA